MSAVAVEGWGIRKLTLYRGPLVTVEQAESQDPERSTQLIYQRYFQGRRRVRVPEARLNPLDFCTPPAGIYFLEIAMDVEEFAKLFRVTPGTVRTWIREGMPCKRHGTKGAGHKHIIDLESAVKWYFEANRYRLELIREKAGLFREQANAQKHKNDERARDLASSQLWQREVGRAVDHVRGVLLAIPAREARALVGIRDTAKIHAHLTETIHAALRKLAQYDPR